MSSFARLAAALCLVTGATSAAAENPAQSPFEVSTMVSDGALKKDGGVWFTSLFDEVRFELSADDSASAEHLWRMVLAANQSRRELKIRFNPAEGNIDEESATLVFPICSVSLDEEQIRSAADCGTPGQHLSKKQELLVGWALHQKSSHIESRKLLDRAVASTDASRAFRLAAVKAHANLLESIGYETEPQSEEGDKAHVAALADYRTLAQLQPDVADHALQIGAQFEALGDYGKAEQAYRELVIKWPDEDYRVNIRLAAIERLRGNYDRALELTNRVAEKYPDQLGMKFYYHRGWTLTKLQRYDEAISDFTAGLKEQPDYYWAYARRACALSQLGQLRLALADMEITLKLMEGSPVGDRKDLVHNHARVRAVEALLRQAVSAGSIKPMPEVCEGYWASSETLRSPSPLLPR